MSEFYYPLECGWDIIPGARALVSNTAETGLPIGLSPIETGLGWRLKMSTFCSKNFSPILFWGADLGGRVPFSI